MRFWDNGAQQDTSHQLTPSSCSALTIYDSQPGSDIRRGGMRMVLQQASA